MKKTKNQGNRKGIVIVPVGVDQMEDIVGGNVAPPRDWGWWVVDPGPISPVPINPVPIIGN